jgi:phenylalanine-4-hydroxylase
MASGSAASTRIKSFEDFKKKGTAEQLICYAYLKALDNYNDVEEAMAYAQIAIKKDKKASYTINIICGLIEAQYYFNGNWCMVWKSTNKVRNNKKLNVDLAPEAIKNIFEYMDLYKDQC